MERPRERAQGADDRSADVSAGRGDDARGEGGRIEAVVDGEHEVLLDRPGHLEARLDALDHPQVVRCVIEVGSRRNRVEAEAQAVQRRDHGRGDRSQSQTVATHRGGIQVERGLEVLRSGDSGEDRAQSVERPVAARLGRHLRRQSQQRWRQISERTDLDREVLPDRPFREGSIRQQRPHVLEGALTGQFDRRVLPIVEEALRSTHVTDRGVGDDDALQPSGRVGRGLAGGADRGDLHQVPHGQDALEHAGVDDGQVSVAAVGEQLEGLVDRGRGGDGVGSRGHPLADGCGAGVDSGGRRAHEVPLRQDADRESGFTDHDDRADRREDHGVCGRGDRLGGGCRHDR